MILNDDDNPIIDSTAVVSNFRTRVDHLPVALGKLLTKCGFEYWDLGMELEYKRRLGAELMGRKDFVTEVKHSRIKKKGLVLQCGGGKENAKAFVEWKQVSPKSIDKIQDRDYLENGTSILRTVSDEE